MVLKDISTEDVTPTPEHLIKSISEQGYRLETAIADLIDNSISASADKIEVLLDTEVQPFTMFIADNGTGMDERALKSALRFPSSTLDAVRNSNDLGRFGLGLKTASFSQTRHFTVLSRTSESDNYAGRTWDVELLRAKGWVLKVENGAEVAKLVKSHQAVSQSYLSAFDDTFSPRTIIVWQGLYKFEDYIQEHNCGDVLKTELAEVTKAHLSLVFHRFLERKDAPLQIRLNNVRVKPFNPFPSTDGVRRIAKKNRGLGNDEITLEGFVLPTRSIEEAKQGANEWVPQNMGLTDLEGIYLYRADRLILHGSWLGLAKRSQRMQLGRVRVEIGNAIDHLLHLNIAKSQVEMPHDIRDGFKEYIRELRLEAEREYHNRTVRSFDPGTSDRTPPFITTTATNRGPEMHVNSEYPLLQDLSESLNADQKALLKTVLRMVRTEINKIRRVHENAVFTGVVDDDQISTEEMVNIVKKLRTMGVDSDFFRKHFIPELGYHIDSLPAAITRLIQ